MSRSPITFVCSECQSTNVLSDAYAAWNEDNQEWELSSTFDKGAYCEDCDGETRLETRKLTTME